MSALVTLLWWVGALTATGLLLLSCTILSTQHARISAIPAGLPWMTASPSSSGQTTLWDRLWASFFDWTASRTPLDAGYERYSKKGLPFVIPGPHWPEVMLPPEDVAWLVKQPESWVSDDAVQNDMFCLDYLAPFGPTVASVHDLNIIKRDLTRKMRGMTGLILEETEATYGEEFPWRGDKGSTNNDRSGDGVVKFWTDAKPGAALETAVKRIVNRVFVGESLSRNRDYHEAIDRWAMAFTIGAATIRTLIPEILHPVLAPLCALPAKYYQRKCRAYIDPLVRKRIAELNKEDALKPDDMLQWLVEAAAAKSDQRELDVENISGKVILYNLFAVPTSSMAAATLFYDLFSPQSDLALEKSVAAAEASKKESWLEANTAWLTGYTSAIRAMFLPQSINQDSNQAPEPTAVLTATTQPPPSASTIQLLRTEARKTLAALQQHPSHPFPATPNLDSALRESLRLNPVAGRGLNREILKPGGITTPSGTFLPQHVHVATAVSSMQRDVAMHGPGADKYEPLRFSDPDEASRGHPNAVHISPEFLSFGLGSRACPGRFFAAQVLKILFTVLLARYEVQSREQRPKGIQVSDNCVPDGEAVFGIRARKGLEDGGLDAEDEQLAGT